MKFIYMALSLFLVASAYSAEKLTKENLKQQLINTEKNLCIYEIINFSNGMLTDEVKFICDEDQYRTTIKTNLSTDFIELYLISNMSDNFNLITSSSKARATGASSHISSTKLVFKKKEIDNE